MGSHNVTILGPEQRLPKPRVHADHPTRQPRVLTRRAAPALTLPSFLKCAIKASVSGFPSLPKISPTSKILATGGGTEAQALSLLDMLDRCEVVFELGKKEEKKREKKRRKERTRCSIGRMPRAGFIRTP